MLTYVIRRLISTIPVLVVVALFVFLLLHLGPGDPAAIIAGDFATPEHIAQIRAKLGLDRPLHVQFFEWAGRLVQGDLGVSIFSNVPVATLIHQRLEPTLTMTVTTILFAVAVAIPSGVIAAWRRGRLADRVVMVLAVTGFSLPVFVLGYVLIYLLSIKAGMFPVQGYVPLKEGVWACLRSLALPSMSLGLVLVALIARMTRASMVEVLNQDYIRTARAKGLAPSPILIIHALKNAGIPIVTTVGLAVAVLIGGVVVTESVFAIPGIGRLTVEAILQKDYPVIQGVILVFSFVYVLVNLLIDMSYGLFDPRIRYDG
ncbi:MAG: ABC transporter permease [Ectothiorhodospiraceae bacterium]|nr:ABC transporter permease [Chromatiales bacterium]MCP5155410.1 ABC transporter permease [Ectothiorhodospiraceae bacterium]